MSMSFSMYHCEYYHYLRVCLDDSGRVCNDLFWLMNISFCLRALKKKLFSLL
ncbi:hypothetical protein RchiOBHm_Chr3g0448881 [Rosa chinensis]|uniref:Uncharacterized protein n=1 Tax=Rosa chinensis TaxID=74649 RepID=A0A2P6R5C1_ROSCH|nr:hypothetical protein RchiOBHm_Chr3g0448881 [Rosa chinensis]